MKALVRILFPRAAKIAKLQKPAESESTRFCKDCRFHSRHREYPNNPDLDRCNAPQNLKVHLVTGRVAYRVQSCNGLRSYEIPKFCGPKAIWFEPIEKAPS